MIKKIMASTVGLFLAVMMVGVVAAPAQAWVSVGSHTQHPSSGGEWTYGFWDAKLRSYYTVNACHGSTVIKYSDSTETARSRSADTASGQQSVAEIWTVNSPSLEASYYYRTC